MIEIAQHTKDRFVSKTVTNLKWYYLSKYTETIDVLFTISLDFQTLVGPFINKKETNIMTLK